MTAIATKQQSNAALYESLALKGDLSALSPQEKAVYYSALCERLGLDPATQPFTPLKLNNKEILYATKGATDQLARIHNVNRQIVDEKEMRGVYIVTVEATLPNGRKEQSKGAVTIDNLKGDAFCNAIMKAETKAKRRATLSILGLGMLDESEMETIPAYNQQPTKAALIENGKQAETPVADTETRVNADHEAKKKEIGALCRQLNATGKDSIKWGKDTLTEFVNNLYEVEDGVDALSTQYLDTLIEELEMRLDTIVATEDIPE